MTETERNCAKFGEGAGKVIYGGLKVIEGTWGIVQGLSGLLCIAGNNIVDVFTGKSEPIEHYQEEIENGDIVYVSKYEEE